MEVQMKWKSLGSFSSGLLRCCALFQHPEHPLVGRAGIKAAFPSGHEGPGWVIAATIPAAEHLKKGLL